MKMLLWLIVVGVIALGAYVRLAPSDPARWHVAPRGDARDMKAGVVRVVETGPGGLVALDAIVRKTPRTTVLAGLVPDGMVTYVTRTRVFGFPDYTTAQQDRDILRIYARSRFGRKDFGVNKARVEEWLSDLQ